MRAVFDTNVLVAAFLTEGICAKLLTRARRGDFELIICPFVLQEFERVLAKKFSVPEDQLREVSSLLTEAVHTLETSADCLVSGDADLLELGDFRGTRILAPRDFELLFFD